jgi:hypothetical protein
MSQLSKQDITLINEELKKLELTIDPKLLAKSPLLSKIVKFLQVLGAFGVIVAELLFKDGNFKTFRWYNPADIVRAFKIVFAVISLYKGYKELIESGEIPEGLFDIKDE